MMLEAQQHAQEVELAKDMLQSWYHVYLDATSQIQPGEGFLGQVSQQMIYMTRIHSIGRHHSDQAMK